MRLAQIAELIERSVQSVEPLRRQPSHRGFDCRNLRQRRRQRQYIARIRRLQRHAAQKPLQVEHAVERAAQFLARDRILYAGFHRIQARIDFSEIERRPQQPGPQQALAHGRDRGVDRAKQGNARIRLRQTAVRSIPDCGP